MPPKGKRPRIVVFSSLPLKQIGKCLKLKLCKIKREVAHNKLQNGYSGNGHKHDYFVTSLILYSFGNDYNHLRRKISLADKFLEK